MFFLLGNALVASLDGFIIGISLKLAKTKLTFTSYSIFFLTNLIIYYSIITLYYVFHLHFMTTFITTILYLVLAFNAYKEEEKNYDQKLNFKKTLMLAAAHSIDGSIISLNFVYKYTSLTISLIFGITSLLLILIGYYFATVFKNFKNRNKWNAGLFILLALLNLFC